MATALNSMKAMGAMKFNSTALVSLHFNFAVEIARRHVEHIMASRCDVVTRLFWMCFFFFFLTILLTFCCCKFL